MLDRKAGLQSECAQKVPDDLMGRNAIDARGPFVPQPPDAMVFDPSVLFTLFVDDVGR